MFEMTCPICLEPLRKATIELCWNRPSPKASDVATIYEHLDGTICRRNPATGEGVDNILAELRRIGLAVHELRTEAESEAAGKAARTSWERRISN
jgi:hypothetical protein